MKQKIISVMIVLFLILAFLGVGVFPDSMLANDNEWTPMYGITGWNLYDVWGDSVFNVFAVGLGGTILHYNGIQWSAMNSQTGNQLEAVWGCSPSDVYAIGSNSTVLHYDGNINGEWVNFESNNPTYLFDVWCAPSSFVYATGGNTVYAYDGYGWVDIYHGTSDSLIKIWGSSASDIFAVGYFGEITHYDGNNWNLMNSGTTNHLQNIWGTSPTDVFAVGSTGTILHYDGNNWNLMDSGTDKELRGIWGASSSDVYAVGRMGTILHYDGNTWSQTNSNILQDLEGVWGNSDSTVFAVGYNGAILQYTPVYSLMLGSTAGGSVTSLAEGISTHATGEIVSLVAGADEGYEFCEWAGDVSTIANVNSASTTITMNGNYSIIANFLPSVIPGDVNGDSAVNALDITKVERIIAGLD